MGTVEEKSQEALRIWLLGGFRVSVGPRTVGEDVWRLKKAKSLIKLLALAPSHQMHREQLAQWLWPNSSDSKAQANSLRQALHAARRTLVVKSDLSPTGASSNSYLRLLEDQVTLCPEGSLWVDVAAFEEAATMARRVREPAAYRTAIDLYAGELLPEDRYEEWAQERREGLQFTHLSLLLELAVLYEERGEFEGAIEALRKAVVAEPTNENAQAGLVRLYSVTGRQGESLLQYERLRKALSEKFGIEEVGRRLYEEIRAGRAREARTLSEENRGPSFVSAAEPSHSPRHNLPVERNRFVGREDEMVEVGRLLSMTGLLTLTGAGGSGKTRFALAVAKSLMGTYPEGAWLVELASLSEPELVGREVAQALGVREQPGRPLIATLKEHLSSKELLLVVDNCEHLIEAVAGLVGTLLNSCPKLKVLATSREALNVPGELVWPVPSLSAPDGDGSGVYYSPATVEELGRYESVCLFVERARYRRPSFELTSENAGAMAEICCRLEGIPLAIELAAARVGVLSVGQIAARLEDSLGLLASGSRTVPSRQRTLRSTLEWSYELLGQLERELFGRLAGGGGGWGLEAAEAVGAGRGIEEEDVLDVLSRLVDKSLVVAEAGESEEDLRFRMLEPVRQYGREKLEESGEADEVGGRHALFFLALAEEVEPKINTAERRRWLERLENEHDNLRAALAWSRDEAQGETGLRLAGALLWFWFHRGYFSEGRRWLVGALAAEESTGEQPTSPAARAKALCGAGLLAWMQGDQAAAGSRLEESVTLWRELGDKQGLAQALRILSHVTLGQGAPAVARSLGEESVKLFREGEDEFGLATSLATLGIIALAQEEYVAAQASLEESVAICRETEDDWALSLALRNLGIAALRQSDYERAAARLGESVLALQEPSGGLGLVNLDLLAAALSMRGDHEEATRLFGAAEAVREAVSIPVIPSIRADYDRGVAAARTGLGEEAFAAAWAEGKAMLPEQAIEYTLSAEGEEPAKTLAPEGSPTDGGQRPAALTPREREVAALVAQELTNSRIAKELMISERTVTTHVHKILKKLNFRSRLQIAAWAMEQELLR